MSQPFRHRFRVRFAEVDPQGVVFNSRYLEYADLVLTEYWRASGIAPVGEGALEFHVVEALVKYRAPIRADEIVEGRARTGRVGSSSVATEIELHGDSAPDDLRAEISLVHVHVDLPTGKAAPLPQWAREALLA